MELANGLFRLKTHFGLSQKPSPGTQYLYLCFLGYFSFLTSSQGLF